MNNLRLDLFNNASSGAGNGGWEGGKMAGQGAQGGAEQGRRADMNCAVRGKEGDGRCHSLGVGVG